MVAKWPTERQCFLVCSQKEISSLGIEMGSFFSTAAGAVGVEGRDDAAGDDGLDKTFSWSKLFCRASIAVTCPRMPLQT